MPTGFIAIVGVAGAASTVAGHGGRGRGQLGDIVGCRRMLLAGVLGPVLGVEVLGSLLLAGSFGAVTSATGGPVAIIVGLVFLLPRNAR